jgi:heme O synthase-like polyprenyltransferase
VEVRAVPSPVTSKVIRLPPGTVPDAVALHVAKVLLVAEVLIEQLATDPLVLWFVLTGLVPGVTV